MTYFLMNHEYPTAHIDISDGNHRSPVTVKLLEILDAARLPFSIRYADDKDLATTEFLYSRAIPDGRYGYGRLIALTEYSDPMRISLCARGISLADGFWLKKEKDRITWKSINYYDNSFDCFVGDYIFHKRNSKTKHKLDSPDLTIPGRLRKIWRKYGDQIYLLKMADPHKEECIYNELIGTEILTRLCKYKKTPFVKYRMDTVNGIPICYCKSFLDKKTEFISAYELALSKRKPAHVSLEGHLLERMKHFNVPDYLETMKVMRLFDYISSNTDRHLLNFGVLRNVDTLEFTGVAPIFDNGGSLWSDERGFSIESRENEEKSARAVLSLNIDIDDYNLDALNDIGDVIENHYRAAKIDKDRIDITKRFVKYRMDVLNKEFYEKKDRVLELDFER